jgi:hypothetical protein
VGEQLRIGRIWFDTCWGCWIPGHGAAEQTICSGKKEHASCPFRTRHHKDDEALRIIPQNDIKDMKLAVSSPKKLSTWPRPST